MDKKTREKATAIFQNIATQMHKLKAAAENKIITPAGESGKTLFIDGEKWNIVSGIEYSNYERVESRKRHSDGPWIDYRHTTRTITMNVRNEAGKEQRLTIHPLMEETPTDLIPVAIENHLRDGEKDVYGMAEILAIQHIGPMVLYAGADTPRPSRLVEIRNTDRHFFTIPAAAEYAGKNPETISAWIKCGLLPCDGYAPGKKLVRINVKASDIDRVKLELAPKNPRPKKPRR